MTAKERGEVENLLKKLASFIFLKKQQFPLWKKSKA
jgi:hypothetical protein